MKLLIFGIPGSGKTTFANRLGAVTGIEVFHIDRHFFESGGWSERPQEDFLRDVKKCLERTSWIIDGNGMRTLEMRFKEADIAIYCCPPRWICLERVLYRWLITLGQVKPDGPEGATNSVSWRLVKYLWKFTERYDSPINTLRKRYPTVRFFCVKSSQEFDHLFQKLTQT